MKSTRRSLAIAALLGALFAPSVHAQPKGEGTSTTPAAASEKSHIKPVGERQIGKRERPTVKKKQEKAATNKREVRLSLQIPEKLRAVLLKRIDQRIARNNAKTKKLRLDAMKLLDKFIGESPEDSPSSSPKSGRSGSGPSVRRVPRASPGSKTWSAPTGWGRMRTPSSLSVATRDSRSGRSDSTAPIVSQR